MSGGVVLTEELQSHLESAITLFGSVQRQRGRALQSAGAVLKVNWEPDGRWIEAAVRGGRRYRVRLAFINETVETECTCPYGEYCKHAAAVVFHLLRQKPTTGDGPDPGPLPTPAGSSGLHQLVRSRTRGKLARKCLLWLDAAETWRKAGLPKVKAEEFYKAFGRQFYWGYHQDEVRIFPREASPATPEEFLAWLSLAARRLGVSLPAPVPQAVDAGLVKQCTTLLEEIEAVRQWKSSLALWAEPPGAAFLTEFRLRLAADGATVEMRSGQAGDFVKATRTAVDQALRLIRKGGAAALSRGSFAVLGVTTDDYGNFRSLRTGPHEPPLVRCLAGLLEDDAVFDLHVVGATGQPLERMAPALRWTLDEPAGGDGGGSYNLQLLDNEGQAAPPPLAIVPGRPCSYITRTAVYTVASWPRQSEPLVLPAIIPARALESAEGLAVLRRLELPVPARLAPRIRRLRRTVEVEGKVVRPDFSASDYAHLRARAVPALPARGPLQWSGEGWHEVPRSGRKAPEPSRDALIDMDDSVLPAAAAWLQSAPWRPVPYGGSEAGWLEQRIHGKDWPQRFAEWLERRPEGCALTLDRELSSLADGRVAGRLRLDVEEVSHRIDWFDLRVSLEVADTELREEEVALLLKAAGRWVRLEGKGWRRLEWDLTAEEQEELAALGLDAHDIGPDRQRLHVLQLGALAKGTSRLLPEARTEQVRRRLEEIKTRVNPDLPRALTAHLRPYQVEGFHFLAYLAENRFGGVLADDMGLGKTVQALAWLAWLREHQRLDGPALVVCPKSVQDNWRAEAEKFYPGLRVEVWNRANAGSAGLDGTADLLVIHYAQMRTHAELLQQNVWGAVIIDEAQAIKNPASQNARTACALVGAHRLALTGTPIENRLTDLWSIFSFAMPGVLGHQAAFKRQFERRDDPLARRRLAARTRPFLLRRTKNEVARDLPERVEEDLLVELEGRQADLYRAELKRARAQLLKARTPRQLDKLRFNILTSLLRLRQICCHPALVGFSDAHGEEEGAAGEDSAKVSALLETLEPLIDEGHKVLVFSQFVTMLEILEAEAAARSWKRFTLTGDTEDRGALVVDFQNHQGPAVFFISLKAGGTGLNLTAASYVVLFDPWWNPAVEAQAIDRTHRIGQKNTVFAYRLLVKNSIEEKIRALQKHKGRLAQDILGEENFAQALTLDDFRFLLGEDGDDTEAPPVRRKIRHPGPL
jgi:superfamily II DNA or RNA helicase